MKKKEVAVIGLGVFGYNVAVQLEKKGHKVLAVDRDRQGVERIKDQVTAAVIADVTDENALAQLDIGKFDIVILGLGSSLESMVLAVTHLKRQGVKWIIARAGTETEEEILLKVGADEVVMPEKQSARRLADFIALPNIVEFFDLGGEMSVAEIRVDKRVEGKTLQELDLRKRFGVTVLMIKEKNGAAQLITSPKIVFKKDDIIIVAGKQENIERCFAWE
jgi:trk system potassium uptake protein TrkA